MNLEAWVVVLETCLFYNGNNYGMKENIACIRKHTWLLGPGEHIRSMYGSNMIRESSFWKPPENMFDRMLLHGPMESGLVGHTSFGAWTIQMCSMYLCVLIANAYFLYLTPPPTHTNETPHSQGYLTKYSQGYVMPSPNIFIVRIRLINKLFVRESIKVLVPMIIIRWIHFLPVNDQRKKKNCSDISLYTQRARCIPGGVGRTGGSVRWRHGHRRCGMRPLVTALWVGDDDRARAATVRTSQKIGEEEASQARLGVIWDDASGPPHIHPTYEMGLTVAIQLRILSRV